MKIDVKKILKKFFRASLKESMSGFKNMAIVMVAILCFVVIYCVVDEIRNNYLESPKTVDTSEAEQVLQPENAEEIKNWGQEWEWVDKIPANMFVYYPIAEGNVWRNRGQYKAYCIDCKNNYFLMPYESTDTIKYIRKNKTTGVHEIYGETCLIFDEPDSSSNRCEPYTYYLINNNFCYDVDCEQVEISFPLNPGEVLMDGLYRDRLAIGIDDKNYVNYVSKKIAVSVLGKRENDCFEIKYYTLPSETLEVFCYGVGYVSYSSVHHGPYDDYEEKLVGVNFEH